MRDIKDSKSCVLRIGFDGKVHKHYRGPLAERRFDNEVAILRHLQEKECPYVPQLLEVYPEDLYIITTNCGARADRISEEKANDLFQDLEENYGVRQLDPFPRNVTYDPRKGQFCLIDFEFAAILGTDVSLTPEEAEKAHEAMKRQL
jgi:hypothetical protein